LLKKRKKTKTSPEPVVSNDKGKGKAVETISKPKMDAAPASVAASA
jgi:hypothetical protein